VISQSGALCAAILDMAKSRGLGLAKVISIGNKANLSRGRLSDACSRQDPQTKVIACYLESIADGDALYPRSGGHRRSSL
jgi:acyl-CoA synthetase (NDP forming)